MTTSNFDEEDLVNRLRLGDRRAFGLIYQHYKNDLWNYCSSLTKDREAAEDVLHEVFLRIWEKSNTLNDPRSFRPWIFSIARNQALLLLRDQKPFEELSEELSAQEESPLESMFNEEQSAQMNGLLDHLRPAYRELILLRIEGEFSYAEIAAITGKSQSAVRTHLFRARKALVRVYTELYGGNHEKRM